MGVCVPQNDLCMTFADNGNCIECYKGFALQNGLCVVQEIALKDLGCARWDWDAQICLSCSPRFFFNLQGICTEINPNCQDFNAQGVCLGCYSGYDLINGDCQFSELNTLQPSDIGCAEWDWANQICLSCSERCILNANGICTPVDNNCQSYTNSGVCTGCYKGYIPVSYTHLRAHETSLHLVCRLLLEKNFFF